MRIYPPNSLNPFRKGDFMYSVFKWRCCILPSLPDFLSPRLFPSKKKYQCFNKSFIVEKYYTGNNGNT